MKNKLQQTSKRYLVVPIVAIGLVAILAFSSADEVSAYGFDDHRDNFAQAIAQKFNLNQSEVEDVMELGRGGRHLVHNEVIQTQHNSGQLRNRGLDDIIEALISGVDD